jgi:hypothetical protein
MDNVVRTYRDIMSALWRSPLNLGLGLNRSSRSDWSTDKRVTRIDVDLEGPWSETMVEKMVGGYNDMRGCPDYCPRFFETLEKEIGAASHMDTGLVVVVHASGLKEALVYVLGIVSRGLTPDALED